MTTQTVKRALRETLAAWFTRALTPDVPGLVVLDSWPVPGVQLASPTLSVEAPGEVRTEFHAATPYATVPTGGGLAEVSYSYGWLFVDLQVDGWTDSPPARDALALALEDAVAVSPKVTLGLPGGRAVPGLRRRGGLVLPVADLLGAPCDFRLESTPDAVEDDNAAHAEAWRLTLAGTASLHIVTREQCALVQRLLVRVGDRTLQVP